jgi:hypothetical protein
MSTGRARFFFLLQKYIGERLIALPKTGFLVTDLHEAIMQLYLDFFRYSLMPKSAAKHEPDTRKFFFVFLIHLTCQYKTC